MIAKLFHESASSNPDKEAIWCDGESITYRELEILVNKCSQFLSKNGVLYGDHIGMPMNNSILSVAIMIATANVGAALVPVNLSLPTEAIKKAFEVGKVKHVIAKKLFFEKYNSFKEFKIDGVKVCSDAKMEGCISLLDLENYSSERMEPVDITGNETYILTMTSGSTGSPKPIELSQKNKVDRIIAHNEQYNITSDDRILAATPLYHSLAERLVLIPLTIGATSVLLSRFTPEIWVKCVLDQKVSFTIAVSAQLAQIINYIEENTLENISSLRCIVSSSALLDEVTKEKLIHYLKCEFHEMYGTSETSTATDIFFSAESDKKRSVGKAFAGVELRMLDDEGNICEIGRVGEIAVKSKLLCKSYYGMDNVFQDKLTDGYFRTGDLGYLDEDGYLYFAGRKKDIIITGAINVYPIDIDECVSKMDEIAECAAFSYPDDSLGEIVAIAIVLNEGCELSLRAIQRHCLKYLADFQQPRKVFFLKSLPKNAMGKLQRGKIIDEVLVNE